ncbi:GntR family transcriptional regulator [Gordonia humi]
MSDDAASHVRELIVAGALRAGEYIRPETVADELGISATPAREGLLSLQSEGFLRVEPRKGFVVVPLTGDDIRDVFVAQSLLGGELAARAAERVTDDDVQRLQTIQRELEAATDAHDYDAVEMHNHEFHSVVYGIAAAPKLSWMIKGSLGYAPRKFFASVEGWPQASAHDHRAIIDSLRGRDAAAARAAMSAHIRNAGELLAEHRRDDADTDS